MTPGLILAAALAYGTPAVPQVVEPAASDVVVTANRNREQEIHDFVTALTQTPASRRQISRFEDAVCPAVLGLPPSQRDAVDARIRRVVGAVGLHPDRARCTPNLLVFVVQDKRAFIQNLQRRYAYYFTDISNRDVRAMAEGPEPAAAWQIREMRNADGRILQASEGVYVNRTTRAASRMEQGARPYIFAAAVVVERGALTGLTTTQLADYAVMRTLAHADPAQLPASVSATILKVLNAPMGSETPITMTSWDLTFLKSLYAAPKNLTAPADRAMIGRQFERMLDGAGKGAN